MIRSQQYTLAVSKAAQLESSPAPQKTLQMVVLIHQKVTLERDYRGVDKIFHMG